jgi:curli biogenesis system outer membrane secretion channel CsgG
MVSKIKLASFMLSFALIAAAPAQQKKRVAVMNFDYSAVTTNVTQLWGTNQDIGKGIADMLVDKLVEGGTFSVIERKMLDKILAEQNFSNSDRADPNSAAKIGKILGVDAIIVGSITQFGRDDKSTGLGAAGTGLGKFGIGGVKTSKSTAVVQLTARMINTSTAEILASVQGKGEDSRSGTGILGAGATGSGGGGAGLDMKSSNFAATILGVATNKAVVEVARGLDAKATTLPTVAVSIDGVVADAAPDGTIIINIGTNNGVKVGDTLAIKRMVREVKDPASGKVLRRVEDAVGTIRITEADATSAVGKFSGNGPAKVGDSVSNVK